MQEYIIHLGSNVGDRSYNIELAEIMIARRIGMIMKHSRVFETQAWGEINQDTFLNKALSVLTDKPPLLVLKTIKYIERKMGRVETKKWGPRVIDIDILFAEKKL